MSRFFKLCLSGDCCQPYHGQEVGGALDDGPTDDEGNEHLGGDETKQLRWQGTAFSDIPVPQALNPFMGLDSYRDLSSYKTFRGDSTFIRDHHYGADDDMEYDPVQLDPTLTAKAIVMMNPEEDRAMMESYSGKQRRLALTAELPSTISELFELEATSAQSSTIRSDAMAFPNEEWELKRMSFIEAEEFRETMLKVTSFEINLLTYDEGVEWNKHKGFRSPDSDTLFTSPWEAEGIGEEKWKTDRLTEVKRRVTQMFKHFLADLYKGTFLTQLHLRRVMSNTGQPTSLETYAPLHCKLLDDLSTMVLDQHSGKLVLLPLEDVTTVGTVFRQSQPSRKVLCRSAIDSTTVPSEMNFNLETGVSERCDPIAMVTPSSEALEVDMIREDYVMTIEMDGNKLAFVFTDPHQASRYGMCFNLLVHHAKQYCGQRNRGALSTIVTILTDENTPMTCSGGTGDNNNDNHNRYNDNNRNKRRDHAVGEGQSQKAPNSPLMPAPVARRAQIPHSPK